MTKQKFKRGSKVKVSDKLPPYKLAFKTGFEAIVQYSYSQEYPENGCDSFDIYSLIALDKLGNPINSMSWYEEDQLALLDEDTGKGLKIIEKYQYGE